MSMSDAIETHHLRKVYAEQTSEEKTALADLTLNVKRGEVFGFLGPNGAGKTTAVKILLGLIGITSGEARILGQPVNEPEIRRKVGFLAEHFRFHEWLTGDEFLALHADLFRIPRHRSRQRIPQLLERVGLTSHANKKLHTYSKGMLQRIGLAQALLNEPELVLLDEPTSGLDPGGRRMVRDIIHELREGGTTVFLNSHFLSEVEITCDRVAFIKHGEVVQTNTLQTLLEAELSVQVRAHPLSAEIVTGLSRWGRNIRVDGDCLIMTLNSEAILPVINRYLVERGVDIYAIQPQKISLEELFIRVVGDEGGL
jgi:ABC-2 type transport system ATP-binding protein